LYKFEFIAGLTIALSGIILFYTFGEGINDKANAIRLELKQAEAEQKILMEDGENANKELLRIENTSGINRLEVDTFDMLNATIEIHKRLLVDRNYREYLAFCMDYKNDLFPNQKRLAELKTKGEKRLDIARKAQINNVVLGEKNNILKLELNKLMQLGIIATASLIFGLLLAAHGYTQWKSKVQKQLDEKLKLELLHLKKDKPGIY
ncbi:MAG: hypothetical protein ICV79_06795, partial [Flavisolibacter sp.]|nr:hypothetical protein [Flavisolibacter sp.]